MSESWRRKTYNEHRSLLLISDILECPYPGAWVCLDGAHLAMLRNMCQYLHYRSTWVSEYHEQYYIAPSNEEWDDIQAVVAELEGRLMVCEEFTEQFARIAAALECMCATGNTYSGLTESMVDGYVNDGTMSYDIPPYEGQKPQDEHRCAIANLTWYAAYSLVVDVAQPAQSAAVEGLLPRVLALMASWLEEALEWAVGPILDAVKALISAWVADELAAVAQAYVDNRQDLICAVYEGLATDVRDAAARASMVINAIEGLSIIDKAVMRLLFGSYFIGIAMQAWTDQSEWAVLHSDEVSCTGCEQEPTGILCDDPIRPALYDGDFFTSGTVVSMGIGNPPLDCTYMGPALSSESENTFEGSYMVDAYAVWYSGKPTENTVGYVTVEAWVADPGEWVPLANVTCTTSGPAGTVFETESNDQGPYNMDLYSKLRIAIAVQPMTCVQDPGLPAFNVAGFCFVFTPVE